jgi:hypothetical protein
VSESATKSAGIKTRCPKNRPQSPHFPEQLFQDFISIGSVLLDEGSQVQINRLAQAQEQVSGWKQKILAKAMRLTGRSRRRLLLWQRKGCNLASVEDLQIWHLRSLHYSGGQASNQILAASSRLDGDALFPASAGRR